MTSRISHVRAWSFLALLTQIFQWRFTYCYSCPQQNSRNWVFFRIGFVVGVRTQCHDFVFLTCSTCVFLVFQVVCCESRLIWYYWWITFKCLVYFILCFCLSLRPKTQKHLEIGEVTLKNIERASFLSRHFKEDEYDFFFTSSLTTTQDIHAHWRHGRAITLKW